MSLPTALLDSRAQNGDVPEIDPAARPVGAENPIPPGQATERYS